MSNPFDYPIYFFYNAQPHLSFMKLKKKITKTGRGADISLGGMGRLIVWGATM